LTIEYEWLIGLGLMFGFALVMSTITFKSMESFFAFLLIFNGFVCWAELLPLWTLVLNIIILTFIMYLSITKRSII